MYLGTWQGDVPYIPGPPSSNSQGSKVLWWVRENFKFVLFCLFFSEMSENFQQATVFHLFRSNAFTLPIQYYDSAPMQHFEKQMLKKRQL